MCKCMKCYLVTMDFSLSAERQLWGKRKLIGAFKFFSFELIFFLRTNFKNVIKQMGRTSDNSWLKSIVRESSYHLIFWLTLLNVPFFPLIWETTAAIPWIVTKESPVWPGKEASKQLRSASNHMTACKQILQPWSSLQVPMALVDSLAATWTM